MTHEELKEKMQLTEAQMNKVEQLYNLIEECKMMKIELAYDYDKMTIVAFNGESVYYTYEPSPEDFICLCKNADDNLKTVAEICGYDREECYLVELKTNQDD